MRPCLCVAGLCLLRAAWEAQLHDCSVKNIAALMAKHSCCPPDAFEVSVYRKAVNQPDNRFALVLTQNHKITRCIWQQALGVVQMTMCSGKRSCDSICKSSCVQSALVQYQGLVTSSAIDLT